MLGKHIAQGRTYLDRNNRKRFVQRFQGGADPSRTVLWCYLDDDGHKGHTERLIDFAKAVLADVSPSMAPGDTLLTPQEAGARLRLTLSTLSNWRVNGMPARFLRVGAILPYTHATDGLRYRASDVERFKETVEAQVQVPGAAA